MISAANVSGVSIDIRTMRGEGLSQRGHGTGGDCGDADMYALETKTCPGDRTSELLPC